LRDKDDQATLLFQELLVAKLCCKITCAERWPLEVIGGSIWHDGQGGQKNLRLCRVDAFENPLLSEGASRPDFGSHYGVGLQAPDDI
jgi:hypothetical protein